jgi:hypothetical protein
VDGELQARVLAYSAVTRTRAVVPPQRIILSAQQLRSVNSARRCMQVLAWSAFSAVDYNEPGQPSLTQTAIFNPATGAVSAATVDATNHDMFCPGISMLGRCAS